MSVIPDKADIHRRGLHVRFVPQADMGRRDASCWLVRNASQVCFTCLNRSLFMKQCLPIRRHEAARSGHGLIWRV